MPTLIHQRVRECQTRENPKTICRVESGWFVLGDVQFLPGYSLLLPDPVVGGLNNLQGEARLQYLADMALLGDAVLECTDAYRINYEILGNTEPALHAHLFPRFENEDSELKPLPVWFYDWKNAPAFDRQRDQPVMDRIRQYVMARCK